MKSEKEAKPKASKVYRAPECRELGSIAKLTQKKLKGAADNKNKSIL